MNAAARALVPAVRAAARRTSVVLCYHGIGRTTVRTDPDFLRVDPDTFRAQVELLLAAGFELVTVADLAARIDGGSPPAGLAALSFDDGLDDNHDVALPILREHGAPATVYVVSGMIGKPNPWLDPSLGCRMMTEDELRTLVDAGWELGAHTVTHPDLSQLDHDACLDEMVRSRDAVAAIQGRPVRTFAYPFCLYGDAAVAAAEAAGFEAAVTCHERGGWSRFELRRPMITGKDGLTSFVLKVTGAYYPLFHSAAGRAVRVSTRELRRRVRARAEAG
jgi:peptidoglycan/xylan/chitin deacetylase (PgdA/CDA1 family)